MSGEQHLTSGVTLSVLGVAMYMDIMNTWTDEKTLDVIETVREFIIPSNFILIPFCIAGLLLGLLMPDCDNPKSLLGRYFHIPIEHRTWLHTIWFVLILALPGLLFKPFFCVGIGAYLHLLCDAPSKCGICWLFPNYKRVGYGKVKKGHYIYLYDSEPVAWILCGVILTFTILYILGALGIIGPIRIWITSVDKFVEAIVSFIVNLF